MKKSIALLFILAMCGTLLPAVLSYEQKKVVLFSTVEEEHPEQAKGVKGKEVTKAFCSDLSYPLAGSCIHTAYPNLFILFSDDPCLVNHAQPPDWFC